MKYIKQFGIIMFITFLGEVLKYLIPLPIPTSIYGLCIMEILLITGILKLEQIKEVGMLLIELMPIMFIPSSVGIMTSWGTVKDMFIPIMITTIISTIIVMVISGKTTQYLMNRGKKDGTNSN